MKYIGLNLIQLNFNPKYSRQNYTFFSQVN